MFAVAKSSFWFCRRSAMCPTTRSSPERRSLDRRTRERPPRRWSALRQSIRWPRCAAASNGVLRQPSKRRLCRPTAAHYLLSFVFCFAGMDRTNIDTCRGEDCAPHAWLWAQLGLRPQCRFPVANASIFWCFAGHRGARRVTRRPKGDHWSVRHENRLPPRWSSLRQ